MARDLSLSDTRTMKMMSAESIASTTEQVVECTRAQEDEIEELEELDQALSSLSRTTERRKEITGIVRRKMSRLNEQLR